MTCMYIIAFYGLFIDLFMCSEFVVAFYSLNVM